MLLAMALKIPIRSPNPGNRGGKPVNGFKKGRSGNPNGRPVGSKNKLTEQKHLLLASTGMTPVEFLTFVYRNQLFEEYDEVLSQDGRTTYFKPKENARRIRVELPQRITAALGAAPYIHKKMPVGIEVKEKNAALISTERLRSMSEQQLGRLLSFMDEFGLTVDLVSTADVPILPPAAAGLLGDEA